MRKVVSFFGLFLLICSCFMGVSCVNNIDGVGSIVLKMPGSSSRATSPAGSPNNNGTYKIDLFCEADRSEQHLTAKAEETVVINEVRIGYCTIILTYYDGAGYAVNRGSAKVFVNKWVQNPVSIKLASFVATPEITKQPQDVTARLDITNGTVEYHLSEGFLFEARVHQDGTFTEVEFKECDSNGKVIENSGYMPYMPTSSKKEDGYTKLMAGPVSLNFNNPGDYYFKFFCAFTNLNQQTTFFESRLIHVKILPVIARNWNQLEYCMPHGESNKKVEIFVEGDITPPSYYQGFMVDGHDVTITAVGKGCTFHKPDSDSYFEGFLFSLTGGGSLTLKGSPSSKLIIDGGGETCGSNYGLIGLNWERTDSGKTAKLYVMENCVLQNNVNTFEPKFDSNERGVVGAAIGFNINDGSQNPGKGSEIVVKGEIINCKGQNTSLGNYDKNIIVTPDNHQVLIVK